MRKSDRLLLVALALPAQIGWEIGTSKTYSASTGDAGGY